MCLSSKPAQLPLPAPAPTETPKPLVSPEEAAQRTSGTTASNRKTSSRSKLRLDVGGTGGVGTGLHLPES